jgi:hypothetical protein
MLAAMVLEAPVVSFFFPVIVSEDKAGSSDNKSGVYSYESGVLEIDFLVSEYGVGNYNGRG